VKFLLKGISQQCREKRKTNNRKRRIQEIKGSSLGASTPLEQSMTWLAGVVKKCLGPSSDTAWYRGSGWLEARPQ
jgi:hypothetical protein